jgi:glycosyltransferase involved in cell wall biosynthesis/GT2 family glycosyltransferase
MKVALAHAHVFRFTRGIERYTVALASALARAGVEATIVTLQQQPSGGAGVEPVRYAELDPRVRVHTLPNPRYHVAVTAIPLYLADFCRRGGYDHILLAFGLNGEGVAARLAAALPGSRTRYSIVFHFPYDASPARFVEFRRYGLLAHASQRIAVSAYIARSVREHLGVSSTIVPEGVDLQRFRPDAALGAATRRALGIGPDERTVLTVGALEPRKGMARLLRALAPTAGQSVADRLIVVGDGPQADELRAEAAHRGLADRTLWIPRSLDLPALYNAADAFALLSDHEAFGLVALEAMACGLPVVVSAGSAFPEFVVEGAGVLVDPEDTAAAHGSLATLLGDPGLRARMGQAARRHVDGAYGWDTVAERMMALLAETTDGRRAPAEAPAPCTMAASRGEAAPEETEDSSRIGFPPEAKEGCVASWQGRRLKPPRGVAGRCDTLAAPGSAPAMPTLSVLIATYNRAELLDRTLRSLLDGGTEQPDEIVVVNGGRDRTAEVVAGYIAAGAPVRLIEVVNVGLSNSQNAGYPRCRGDIVATLDDDVVVAPDWVRRVKAAHAAYPQAGGIGGRTLNEFPAALAARFEQAHSFDVRGAAEVRAVRTVAGVNMSYKRVVMEQVGPFDESLPSGMDVDYNWRVARAGYPILYDPSITLTHHNRTSLRGVLRQQFWYGRGFLRTRRKWPDLPSRTPRGLWGWRNWVKMGLFVLDPLYQPLLFARRAATWRDRLAFAALAFAADIVWKAGFLDELVRMERGRRGSS